MVESFEQNSSSPRRSTDQKKQSEKKRAMKIHVSVGEGLFGQARPTND